ncbi:MAG: adenylosuccinate synthase [Candidatus Micrarchaeota archaeon]
MIVGAQWGDEGKGRVIDNLAVNADAVVRFQGGNNAGHTVVVDGETFKFHLIPSGVVYGKRGLIGASVVVDPRVLSAELRELKKRGKKVDVGVDHRAHVILPWHVALDKAQDKDNGIGTTCRGIGPAYEDKAARIGIRFGEFCDEALLVERIRKVHAFKDKVLRSVYDYHELERVEAITEEYVALSRELRHLVCDASVEVNEFAEQGKKVLFEGAQAALLDLNHGTYPFVTSSHPIAGSVCSGVGVSPRLLSHIEGVSKAYTTRVGSGPFPTELQGAEAVKLREKGKEFGTTTGRPRRVGWLDLPVLRYSNSLNGFTGFHLTKLDVLGGFDKIKVCVSYDYAGETVDVFSTRPGFAESVKPNYIDADGFPDLAGGEWVELAGKGFDYFPDKAIEYARKIENLLGVPLKSVSVGPDRRAIVWLD